MARQNTLPPEKTFLIDFNLQWVPAALGLPVPSAAAAAIFDVREEELAEYTDSVAAEVREMARDLLLQRALREALGSWPVAGGDTLLAIGDSVTTYLYSYARLLEAMLALQRPQDEIVFLNEAHSGYTTAHGLESTFVHFLALQPDWVLINFGVNDCKCFGGPQAKTLVSQAEYGANMEAMVQAFLQHTPARPLLITPSPVVEDQVNENPEFKAMRMTWKNSDLEAFAAIVRELGERYQVSVVDLMEHFGSDPDPALYLDGLHPGPAGHRLIVQAILEEVGAANGDEAV